MTDAAHSHFQRHSLDTFAESFKVADLAPHASKPLLFTEDVIAILAGRQKGLIGPKMIKSLKSNIMPLQGAKVLKINYKDSKPTSALAQNVSDFSYIKIEFNNLIIAGGVFQTPDLLFKSKMLNKQFIGAQIHVNLKFLATWEHKLHSSQGTIFTAQVQEFMDDGFIFMPTNFNREYLAIAFSWVDNNVFSKIMENYEKSALMTSQVRIRSRAWISRWGIPPLIFWRRRDIQLIKRSAKKMCELLFASGAKEVILPFSGKSMMSLNECNSAIDTSSFRNWVLQSVHAMSSCAMGNGNHSITDSYGRLRGFDNVHLVDASVLPSNMGESPQGTIMAISKMIVESVLQDYRRTRI
jgi:hypothetical protein